MTEDLRNVLDNVRPNFEYNVSYVTAFLQGRGLDMGCGSCPLLIGDCTHVDISPQPLAELQVGGSFVQSDAVTYVPRHKVNFVFSSHMVEDLATKEKIVSCINGWVDLLEPHGYVVLLLPDMQGGRYWTVEEGGNPSHQVDVGAEFIREIEDDLPDLYLIQLDTIPHDKSCTIDVVFRKMI